MEGIIMKKIIISFFILTLLGGQVISYAQNEVQHTEFEAKVIEVKKDVKYRKARDWWKFWQWEDLSSEVKLKAGALLKVGKDSQLELEFINGTRVLVKANSNLEIANGRAGKNKSPYFRSQSLKLTLGEVWVKTIESLSGITRFEVRTPNAVAGVKGTLFNVKVNSKQETEVRVDEGRVLVNNNDDERIVGKLQRLKVNREGEFEEIKKGQEVSKDWKSVKPWMKELEDWVEKKKHEIEEKKEDWKEEKEERKEESEEEGHKDNDQYEERDEELDEDDRNHDKNDDESNNDHRRDDNMSDDDHDKDDRDRDNHDRDDHDRDKHDRDDNVSDDNHDREGRDRDNNDKDDD
ncbi:MAG: Fe2+-dicitrate sensor, membrane component [Candidatus Frackibacter sp. T328-2]|nr:MAG: Fe2+-dicitrate sensor, membrane component [Candidatus Frackibacter sp. T328-2]